MLKKYLLLLLIIVTVDSCTRDDICSEGIDTTPLLIITFKNINFPQLDKSVSNLTILTTDETVVEVIKSITTDSISIPLKTNLDSTKFYFIENDIEKTPGNSDTVTFNYLRENLYVNRACAFKTIYNQLSVEVDPENNTNWIQNIEILSTTIENENQAHITIFH